jgi:hypothetical protein
MARTHRNFARWGAFLALSAALAVAPRGAAAQLGASIYAGGEFDTENMSMLHLGATVAPAGTGWIPFVSGLLFRQSYRDAQDATVTVNGVIPAVGIRSQTASGFFGGSVGYAWMGEEQTGLLPIGAFAGTDRGLVTSLHGEWWGTGQITGQLIASYNWRGDYLWARGRAMHRILGTGPAGTNLGVEFTAQGAGDTDQDYRAFQVGPKLEWRAGNGLRLLGGGGWKTDNRDGLGTPTGGNFRNMGYVRLEAGFDL